MALDMLRHPCFSEAARHHFARIHLPVAPDCNIQCNFCKRMYDCANESRPGVTSAVLSPKQAICYLDAVLQRDPRISVVGIAGPGDPFATPEKTMETLRLVRERHPEMLLCVASNGLAVAPYVDELASLDVSHVTLTVNAVDREIGGKIYAWVRDGKRVYRGPIGAELLWEKLPIFPRMKALNPTPQMIGFGEDYELLFTVNSRNLKKLQPIATRITEIGRVTKHGLKVYGFSGEEINATNVGFSHLA